MTIQELAIELLHVFGGSTQHKARTDDHPVSQNANHDKDPIWCDLPAHALVNALLPEPYHTIGSVVGCYLYTGG